MEVEGQLMGYLLDVDGKYLPKIKVLAYVRVSFVSSYFWLPAFFFSSSAVSNEERERMRSHEAN